MNIYLIKSDNEYDSLLPTDPEFYQKIGLFFPTPKIEAWAEYGEDGPAFYVREPTKTKGGEFLNLSLGALTYSDSVHKGAAGKVLEIAGEVLPARVEARPETFHVLNVLTCYDCFDLEKSNYRKAGSKVVEVFDHVFLPDLIGESSVFKTQVRQNTSIYTVAGRGNPRNEFYSLYHEAGFKGLLFDEVWSD